MHAMKREVVILQFTGRYKCCTYVGIPTWRIHQSDRKAYGVIRKQKVARRRQKRSSSRGRPPPGPRPSGGGRGGHTYRYHNHKCQFPLSRRRNSKTKAGIGAGMYGAPLVPGTASTGGSVASAGPPSLVDVVSGRAATSAAAAPGNAMTPTIYSAGNAIFITAMSRWLNVS